MKYKIYGSQLGAYEMNGVLIPDVMRNSLQRGSESYSFSREIVERSFLPGSVALGTSRLMARSFSLTAQYATRTDSEYDAYIGELMFHLSTAERIEDVTNSKEANITCTGLEVTHEAGAIKRSGSVTLDLLFLDGFWQDVDFTTVVTTITTGNDSATILTLNTGWLQAATIITIDALEAVPAFDLTLSDGSGMRVTDALFGTAGFEQMIIDNVAGTLTVVDNDRSQSIVGGTGYFLLPRTNSNITVNLDSAVSSTLTFTTKFKNRSFA